MTRSPVEEVEFLRDLAGRIFWRTNPAMGFDQSDSDQLYALSDRIAALFAAAPDLLAVVTELLECGHDDVVLMQRAADAVAKAKGAA